MANLNKYMPTIMGHISQKKRDEALNELRSHWPKLSEAERNQALQTIKSFCQLNNVKIIDRSDLELVAA